MKPEFCQALVAGKERIAGWANLLDQINVFPIADGDTGRNLVLSLSPITAGVDDSSLLAERLLFSARGNSGNITSRFLSGFLGAGSEKNLAEAARQGSELARQSIPNPMPGTILSLFESLAGALSRHPTDESGKWVGLVLDELQAAVLDTTSQLPALSSAGVVDSGALGMFIFFDGFFNVLEGGEPKFRRITETFGDRLVVDESWQQASPGTRKCIDAVLDVSGGKAGIEQELGELADSLVTIREGDIVKVHLHTDDADQVLARMSQFGTLSSWASDDLETQTRHFSTKHRNPVIRVMTDGAGSITRSDASRLGITLLDSYINLGTQSIPETHMDPAEMYARMRQGERVSTSQASDFEKCQHYEKLLALNRRALYLCVGSAYTGNYDSAVGWQREHDPEHQLTVIDSGAALGRLGLVALATGRMAIDAADNGEVVKFARRAAKDCEEWVLLDTLRYVAAGGRISKASAMFGNLLHLKPVVSPFPDGVRKMGMVRDAEAQVRFLMTRLAERPDEDRSVFLLQYSDNQDWVHRVPGAELRKRYPHTLILERPLSLTSGAHMGPGTWSLASLRLDETEKSKWKQDEREDDPGA